VFDERDREKRRWVRLSNRLGRFNGTRSLYKREEI